jgi:choline dehydrogenase
LGALLLNPSSRGYVALVSPDPTAKPLIVHNYFAEPADMRSQVDGARIAMDIVATEPFAGCVGEPFMAPASNSDQDITAHTRAHGQTAYHPVGTCKMGDDDLAVVDPELRVRGVEGLRVVDASIMPTIPRGNTNAPTIAIAEKGADLIRGHSPMATVSAAHAEA